MFNSEGFSPQIKSNIRYNYKYPYIAILFKFINQLCYCIISVVATDRNFLLIKTRYILYNVATNCDILYILTSIIKLIQ